MKTFIIKYAAFLVSSLFLVVFSSCEKEEQIAPLGAEGTPTNKMVQVYPFGNSAASALNALSEVTGQEDPNFVDEHYVQVNSTTYNYGSQSQHTLKLFVSPDNDLTDKPVVLLFPGGGFINYNRVAEMEALAEELASKGFAAAVVKYTIDPNDNNNDMVDWIYGVQDIRSAVRYIRKEASVHGFSTTNIFIGGWSNGASIAFNHAFMGQNELTDIDDANLQTTLSTNINTLGWDNADNAGFSCDVKGVIAMNMFTQAEDFVDAGDPALFMVGCTQQQFGNGVVTYGTFVNSGVTMYGPLPVKNRALTQGYVEGQNLELRTEQWPNALYTHPNYSTLSADLWYDISAFLARNLD